MAWSRNSVKRRTREIGILEEYQRVNSRPNPEPRTSRPIRSPKRRNADPRSTKQPPYKRGSQQVNVYPTNAAAMQVASANELHDIAVRNDTRLVHALIDAQKLAAASAVANQKLSINQFVPCHLVESQKSI